jgi:hypothetical protein
VRGGILIVALALAACGAGSGEGLDQNGQPLTGGGNAPPASGLAPTLDSIQTNVFNVNCAVPGCHGGVSAQQGLRLDPGFSAGNLINVHSPQDSNLIRVVPGDPDASFLIQKLQGTQTVGSRMPDGGPYLTTATVNVIRQWIQDGAQQ